MSQNIIRRGRAGAPPTDWIRPPPGLPPPDEPPSYAPPEYQNSGRDHRLAAASYNRLLHIGSVSRTSPANSQPIAVRTPFEFSPAHAIFFQVWFEVHRIPDHAMGVALVNMHDRRYLLARKVDEHTVTYRCTWSPTGWTHNRLRIFANTAIQRFGTRRPNATRWYYFHYADFYNQFRDAPF